MLDMPPGGISADERDETAQYSEESEHQPTQKAI